MRSWGLRIGNPLMCARSLLGLQRDAAHSECNSTRYKREIEKETEGERSAINIGDNQIGGAESSLLH
jgi:hypothetical protein